MTLGHAVKASAPLIQAELYKRRPNEVCVVTDFANILAIKKKVSHIAFALAFLDRAALPQRLFAADKLRRTDFGICFIPCAESHCFVRAISRINRWQFTVDGLYNVESEEKSTSDTASCVIHSRVSQLILHYVAALQQMLASTSLPTNMSAYSPSDKLGRRCGMQRCIPTLSENTAAICHTRFGVC